jgi:CRISPR-associated exonuclease Cas4
MEHTSDVVYGGKLLHETSYPQRNEKHSELHIEANYNGSTLFGKIDFYDARNKVIHETKRSDKIEQAHEWQVKFYLWLLKLNGTDGATAIIEYPLLRHTSSIELSVPDVGYLQHIVREIISLKESGQCPPVIHAKICRSCSYYELCYVGE